MYVVHGSGLGWRGLGPGLGSSYVSEDLCKAHVPCDYVNGASHNFTELQAPELHSRVSSR